MFSWILDFIYDSVKLTDNWITNIVIPPCIYAILHIITYRFVGDLYSLDVIDGRLSGKIAYRIAMLVNIFITIGILWLIKGVLWLIEYIKTFTVLNWLAIIGAFVLMIGLIISVVFIVKKRQEGEKL